MIYLAPTMCQTVAFWKQGYDRVPALMEVTMSLALEVDVLKVMSQRQGVRWNLAESSLPF